MLGPEKLACDPAAPVRTRMPLLNILFSLKGRIGRGDFWYAVLFALSAFIVLRGAIEAAFGPAGSRVLYPPLYFLLTAVCVKRYHDLGRSGWWLLLLLIPVLGPAWVVWSLGARRGMRVENRYGAAPCRADVDYFVVGRKGVTVETIVDDVAGLNPVEVRRVVRPQSEAELRRVISESTGPVSVGGGRFSMGGQTAASDSLHIDMRGLNQVVEFSPAERRIRVQTGIRWCDIQRFLDPHDLSVMIMQSYANFTVGGSLGVNAHGRYVGLGPVIRSVRSIAVVLADGSLVRAGPSANSDLFYGAIGGYGGLGVIVEAELDVVPNTRVARVDKKLPVGAYLEHFRSEVLANKGAIFHNADLYPPHYSRVLSQTWEETSKPLTKSNRLMELRSSFALERYLIWAISETPFGKWRREFLFDPILSFRQKVHWRNYEAGYDVALLEPASRSKATYALQEYFVPTERFEEFVARLTEILRRHGANLLNISIRHACADPGSILAWAREDVFAFVLYLKQRTGRDDRRRTEIWTRDLIEAALSVGGTFYLPYQPIATREQFLRAYPRAPEYFAVKRARDPQRRFRSAFWDKYGEPGPRETAPTAARVDDSEFHAVFDDVARRDAFHSFLRNIFHLYPEDRFHGLITDACGRLPTDREIYEQVQSDLPSIKPSLAAITYALPALRKQKRVIGRQTRQILDGRTTIDGYLEIGTVGRYVKEMKSGFRLGGPLYVCNEVAPTNGVGDVMERGGIASAGRFVPLDYKPLDSHGVPSASLDVVTCFVGLHHAPSELLDGFVKSIRRVLRPGGVFVLRDHDVRDRKMHAFVSLVHTVFNLGLGTPWNANQRELRSFRSADDWSRYLGDHGFRDLGRRLRQDGDPTDNLLMAFVASETPTTP